MRVVEEFRLLYHECGSLGRQGLLGAYGGYLAVTLVGQVVLFIAQCSDYWC